MSGLVENGNGAEAVTAGTKGHGNIQKRVITGNQDIGKTAIRDTDGIRAVGRNRPIKSC